MVGRMKLFHWLLNADGSIFHSSANSRISMVPTQKVGAETPIMANTLME